MKHVDTTLGYACLLAGLMMFAPVAGAAPSCGTPDDAFADFYHEAGLAKTWRITMVSHDHEDHGLHLVEGDSFSVRYNADCEVVMAPGPQLATRWGGHSRLLARDSRVSADLRSIDNGLCTTVGISHDRMGALEQVARPHILRMRMIDTGNGRKLEIRYAHRAGAADDCASYNGLDNVHGGIAHAEN